MVNSYGRFFVRYKDLLVALLLSNGVSILILTIGILDHSSSYYAFLYWNLILAWISFPLVVILIHHLKHSSWLSVSSIFLTMVWLAVFPNSLYMATDLTHLSVSNQPDVVFNAAMLFSFALNGVFIGFIELFLIHKALIKRIKTSQAHTIILFIVLLASFAIYLGRMLRWNSWDVVANPAGVLFDVSDRIINPDAHPQAFVITATFFLIYSTCYFVFWYFVQSQKSQKSKG